MAVSRRRFLQDGIFAATACLAAPLALADNRSMGGGLMTGPGGTAPGTTSTGQAFSAFDHLTRENFIDAVGSSFMVSQQDSTSQPVWMRLLAVNDLPAVTPPNLAMMAVMPKATSAPLATTGFALSFAGTGTQQLPQGTYFFEHATLGKFALFVVSGTGPQQTSSAVINRLDTANSGMVPIVGTSGTPGIGTIGSVGTAGTGMAGTGMTGTGMIGSGAGKSSTGTSGATQPALPGANRAETPGAVRNLLGFGQD